MQNRVKLFSTAAKLFVCRLRAQTHGHPVVDTGWKKGKTCSPLQILRDYSRYWALTWQLHCKFDCANKSTEVCTFHDGCKQGIDQQIFNRRSISCKITHQLNKDWGCVILHEIDLLLKICWSIPCLHPSWKVHTWIEICASLNQRKRRKQMAVDWFLESIQKH